MPGVGKLLKEAQKMQAKIAEAQAGLATQMFEASVAGGAVVSTVNGQGQLVGLKLEAEFLKESPDMVSSTIVSAVAQAQEKATKATEATMGAFGGSLKGLLG
jgi:DNA-binding protein YbaB